MSRSSTMGKIVLLDGDEDFMDERPSSKRMREDLISNQDGDEFDDFTSLQGDDYEVHQARLPRVSLTGDGENDGDSDGNKEAV